MPYEKLTTLSIFFSFLNRLVKILSQMGLWDLTDDNFLLCILVPPQHQLGTHELHECLPNKWGAVCIKEHLLRKTFAWAKALGIGGQYGRPQRCWCGGKHNGENPRDLEHLQYMGKKIIQAHPKADASNAG